MRGNFKLMLTNLNIYYLNNVAIFKYGGYNCNFKPNLLWQTNRHFEFETYNMADLRTIYYYLNVITTLERVG